MTFMSAEISPDNERFLDQAIASGVYPSRKAAIDDAVTWLRQRHELRAHVAEGAEQLKRGEAREFDLDGLRRFITQIKHNRVERDA